MNTFLLKINEPARKNDNIYIVQSNDIIKVGYTSNLVPRMMQYYYHNPNTIFIGSTYREDAQLFERELHSCIPAQVLNEWYPAEMLNLLIEYITNTTILPNHKINGGAKHYYYDKSTKRFKIQTKIEGKNTTLCSYKTEQQAIDKVKQLKQEGIL